MIFHSQDYSSSRMSSCGEHAVTLVLCLLYATPVNVAVLELPVPGIEVSIYAAPVNVAVLELPVPGIEVSIYAAPVNVAVLELPVPGIEVSIVSHLLPLVAALQKQEFSGSSCVG